MAVVPEETAVTFFTTRLSLRLPRNKLRPMPRLKQRAKLSLSQSRRARLDQLGFALVPRVPRIGLVPSFVTAPLTKSELELRNLLLNLSLILMMNLKVFLSHCSHN